MEREVERRKSRPDVTDKAAKVCNENFAMGPKMERGSNFIRQNLAWATPGRR